MNYGVVHFLKLYLTLVLGYSYGCEGKEVKMGILSEIGLALAGLGAALTGASKLVKAVTEARKHETD